MSKIVIDFKHEDVHQPRPWPVGISDEIVTSGLGADDGAQLIGFAHAGVQGIERFADEWRGIDFEEQDWVPVFSANGGFFNWNLPIRGIRAIEEQILDMHFILDIRLSNSAMQNGVEIATALREIAGRLAADDLPLGEWEALTPHGQESVTDVRINDMNGRPVGTWSVKEVAR